MTLSVGPYQGAEVESVDLIGGKDQNLLSPLIFECLAQRLQRARGWRAAVQGQHDSLAPGFLKVSRKRSGLVRQRD
jgi:hypothetical protein